jgi:serine-type D-Ala-D-Ala carboxypeptidase/endopeptidase (penicillin-binding protein 4)
MDGVVHTQGRRAAVGSKTLTRAWVCLAIGSVLLGCWGAAAAADTGLAKGLAALLGPRDAAIVAGPDGRILAEAHADQLLVPASILKVITALAALHYLGEEHRFTTDFYLNAEGALVIKGYGDPFLVSERVALMAARLAERIQQVNGLVLDDTYFAHPIVIPGRGTSTRPYDAPNGALCVNFNTFFFQRQNDRWVSAEPQTPLLPFMIGPIEASGLSGGRITLAGNRSEILGYVGELFDHFLNAAGTATGGAVTHGRADPQADTLVWRYTAEDPLTKLIADLLEFSNNFIANQLLLAVGARVNGPPGTIEKGVEALRSYYASKLGITAGHLVEASGLSRQNRVSARTMLLVLERFQPHHALMRRDGRQWYKTGTLHGISTRAGYLAAENGGMYRFVVMINTPGKTTDNVMRLLERDLR